MDKNVKVHCLEQCTAFYPVTYTFHDKHGFRKKFEVWWELWKRPRLDKPANTSWALEYGMGVTPNSCCNNVSSLLPPCNRLPTKRRKDALPLKYTPTVSAVAIAVRASKRMPYFQEACQLCKCWVLCTQNPHTLWWRLISIHVNAREKSSSQKLARWTLSSWKSVSFILART
jgi:hypothetical protein